MYASRLLYIILVCAILAVPASAQTGFGEFKPGDFAAPQVCGSCHTDNFLEWQGSMHAASNYDPFYQITYSMASNDTDGAADIYCPRCHSPVNFVTGQDSKVTIEVPDIGIASEKGVECDFCHTVTGKTGIGNGLYISSPGNTKYGPWDDALSPYHGAQYSELHNSSEFCSICHYQTHTDTGLVIQNTFQEWLNSPYFEEGLTCQGCHMTPGPGFTMNPGRSTSVGPQREHIWIHNTAGGNVFQTRIQSPRHKALATEMLKAAAVLDVTTQMPTNEIIVLDVTISNVGAGHSIPSGSRALREMWLEVTASDSENVFFSSGELDSALNIDPTATVYTTVYHDASGNITYKEWEAATIVSDNRIAAGSNATQQFQINIPRGYGGPVKISVRLLYRTAPQGFIDELFGAAAEDVPVVEMAKQEVTIREPETGIPGFQLLLSIMVIGILVLAWRKRDRN